MFYQLTSPAGIASDTTTIFQSVASLTAFTFVRKITAAAGASCRISIRATAFVGLAAVPRPVKARIAISANVPAVLCATTASFSPSVAAFACVFITKQTPLVIITIAAFARMYNALDAEEKPE
jgi:hypothetical protein